MKNIIILLLIIYSIDSFSQDRNRLFLGISNTTSVANGFGFSRGEWGLNFGYILSSKETSIKLSMIYIFGGNYITGKKDHVYNYEKSKSYSLNYQLLGVNTGFIFRRVRCRIKPLLQISGIMEVFNDYKEGLLSVNYFLTKNPLPPAGLSYNSDTKEFKNVYRANFYQSTPFTGNIMIGFNIRIISNLYFEMAAGYGLRLMKSKYLEWEEGDIYPDKLKDRPIETHFFHAFDFQLGINSTFSFKKKPKTTTP